MFLARESGPYYRRYWIRASVTLVRPVIGHAYLLTKTKVYNGDPRNALRPLLYSQARLNSDDTLEVLTSAERAALCAIEAIACGR
ncbi:hypothetical protein SAMN06265795_11072 [Noviherbaspirillum humi]|uniref:Uncharacterized protein n=1 Tax=Noviherbaspirillum humi TaxID=1688639 RepID=A0A239IQP7_9BURK|nr:hypothetical protein [Noviherbaspirillum humi]SNS95875.1 hypothetical protein SAMN06265795_11072 [Noviherbaspirillum humi]